MHDKILKTCAIGMLVQMQSPFSNKNLHIYFKKADLIIFC